MIQKSDARNGINWNADHSWRKTWPDTIQFVRNPMEGLKVIMLDEPSERWERVQNPITGLFRWQWWPAPARLCPPGQVLMAMGIVYAYPAEYIALRGAHLS